MKTNNCHKKWNVLSGTCWFTAIVNAVFSTTGYGQEATPEKDKQQSDDASSENVLRYGIFDVRPTLQAGVYYDDNITTSPGKMFPGDRGEIEDLIWTIQPGISLGAGDYKQREANLLSVTYVPNIQFFSSNSKLNTVDHDLKAQGQYRTGPWTFGLQQTYQKLSGNVVDLGTRVDRDLLSTSGFAKYEVSPKTTLDLGGVASFNEYEQPGGTDICYNEYIGSVGMDYAVTPKVKVGPVAKIGFVDMSDQSNQNYEQLLVRVSYLLTEKVALRASVGGELRHFDGGADSELNPVLEAGLSYKPAPRTVVTADAFHREQPSISAIEQNYANTGISVGVRQTFRDVYTASLSTGYEHLNYVSRTSGPSTDRTDNYYFVRVGGEWVPTERVTVGVWYLYRQNTSDNSTFEFNNNQIGLSLAYRF